MAILKGLNHENIIIINNWTSSPESEDIQIEI